MSKNSEEGKGGKQEAWWEGRQGWETGKGGKQEAWCRLCWVGVKVGMGSCASSVEAVTAWRGAWVC